MTITFAIICRPQGGALFTVITWGIQQGKEQEIKNEIIQQFGLKPGLMDDPCFFQEEILKKDPAQTIHLLCHTSAQTSLEVDAGNVVWEFRI